MFDIINSPIVLIMIFVISLFVGNRIYHMGLKRGIENGRLQVLEENMVRLERIELRQLDHFASVLRYSPPRKELKCLNW